MLKKAQIFNGGWAIQDTLCWLIDSIAAWSKSFLVSCIICKSIFKMSGVVPKTSNTKNTNWLDTWEPQPHLNNIPHTLDWSILAQKPHFNPVANFCMLCNVEKVFILYHPEFSTLNLRNELYGWCKHKEGYLLMNT